VIRRDFPLSDPTEVQATLDEYGTIDWQRERERVQLAILKLAAGRLDQLRYHVESAKRDYRDTLAPAEYPIYSRKVSHRSKLSSEKIQAIIDADWKQYQDWLTQ